MSDVCTDLDVGKGITESGCGATYTSAQLHTMCCHRTFSVGAADKHDQLVTRLGRCPTDEELIHGKGAPLHRVEKTGVWRRDAPGVPKSPRGGAKSGRSGRTGIPSTRPKKRVAS